jgi:poly(beta-D-mannuronate) lyase
MRTLLFWISLTLSVAAKDFPIADVAALKSAMRSAQPGDSLVLRAGEWRDAKLVFKAQGTKNNPITLKAAEPGKTILTGRSSLRIGGKHLVIEGLLFQDPDPAVSDLIDFRIDSDDLAEHCRMTNCAVTNARSSDDANESRWIGLYGAGHRLDRCTIQGKSNKGPSLVVWLGGDNAGGHQIDHNYFGPRENLGKNGGETIRLGDSKTSMLAGKCVVEHNLFERCNGETECVSNKSCENFYRENTFLEVSGTLTLRHGNNCTVERNVFLGNDVRGTGGVRIIGEDHVVRGNFFEKLTGDDARSALCLMMGIPDSPAHRYFQVKRARIENNTFIDCEHPILIGLSDDNDATLAPIETTIVGNHVLSPKHTIIEARCDLDGITWKENRFLGKSLGIAPREGIKATEPTIKPLKPISRSEVGTTWSL